MLLTSFPEQAGSDGDIRSKTYLLAVEPYPIEHLKVAVGRFIRGEVEGHNRRFCPSTAELCAEIRRLHALATYARTRKALPAPEPELVISDEERKATVTRLAKLFPGMIRSM